MKQKMNILEYDACVYTILSLLNDEDCANYLSTTRYLFTNYDTKKWWQERCQKLTWGKRAIKKSNHFLRLSKHYTLPLLMAEIRKPEQLGILELTVRPFHKNNMRLLIAVLKFMRFKNVDSDIIMRLKRIDRLEAMKISKRILLKFNLQKIETTPFYKIFKNCNKYGSVICPNHLITKYAENYEGMTAE